MINVNKLKGKIVENGINVATLACKMDIDKATLYRKLKAGGDTFTIKEATLIVNILGLTKEESHAIFFSNIVA